MEIAVGTDVKHTTKAVQGRVIGVTYMKELFERADDTLRVPGSDK